jgi:hypothetical protein
VKTDGPVSAAALLQKAKQFDDGLFAAVELAAQQGAGRFAGKATLLRSLAATLAAGLPNAGGAATAIHAACRLGGLPVAVPEALTDTVRTTTVRFLGESLLSKPLGFYTWTPELSAIFRQDRFLQQPLDAETADDLTGALSRTPGAEDSYHACLRLHARLTNPAKELGLRDAGKCSPFFPPSRSHEVALVERLYEDRPIPEGFDLLGELIRRVRSGDIHLEPGTDAGWYDHQVWSLEPLVVPDRMPEAARLELGQRYRRHLEDLFRGAHALARETHVKLAGGGYGGRSRQRPIRVPPGLSVEPLPSLYARRAASYRFVRSVLEEAFGADAVAEMHRLTQEGAVTPGLAEELDALVSLFEGAAATARRDLGMEAGPGDEQTAGRLFRDWKAHLTLDLDVGRDCRMMVPVFFDLQRQKTKVWTFLGWRMERVYVGYRTKPVVLGVEPSKAGGPSGNPPPIEFCGEYDEFAVPEMAEVYVAQLLDRDEFRRHCDRHRTRDAILANLR